MGDFERGYADAIDDMIDSAANDDDPVRRIAVADLADSMVRNLYGSEFEVVAVGFRDAWNEWHSLRSDGDVAAIALAWSALVAASHCLRQGAAT